MDDLISRDDAFNSKVDFLDTDVVTGTFARGWNACNRQWMERIMQLPSAQPDPRLAKIAGLVEGTIDHFDLDDAMDLLYQIKDVIGER